jgi:hypothetical protein
MKYGLVSLSHFRCFICQRELPVEMHHAVVMGDECLYCTECEELEHWSTRMNIYYLDITVLKREDGTVKGLKLEPYYD